MVKQSGDGLSPAGRFVDGVLAQMVEVEFDQVQVHEFWRGNLAGFDEGVLAQLPGAFQRLREKYSPEFSASIFNDFGVFIWQFPLGVRSLNLEIAIAANQRALEVYTREAFSEYWAMTQNNLAAAYYERIRGERGDNIEEAIAACQQALEVRTREAFPEQWAMTQNNLANAYCDRVRGERGENIEEAIAAYQRALEVRTREAFPEQWAQTQLNLGSAYRKKNETEQAIAAYKQAQEVYTREAFPEDWAKTQWGLANAYGDRDGDGDLDQAILLFQDVLTVTSYKTETFINANYLLGNLLNRRYDRHNNPEDLAAAERAYSTALDCIDPEHYDIEDYRNALPSVRAIMGGRLVRDGQWKKGLELLLTSLDELKDAKDDQAYANALYQTARAYEYEDNQPKARTYYRDALRLYQRLNNTLAIARTRYGLGNVLVNQGFPEKGKIELEAARELYQTLEKSDKVAECDQRLSSLCQTIEKLEAYDISAPESPPW